MSTITIVDPVPVVFVADVIIADGVVFVTCVHPPPAIAATISTTTTTTTTTTTSSLMFFFFLLFSFRGCC